MTLAEPILVAGGGGFIGGHLVKRLLEEGNRVRAVDIKPAGEWWQRFPEAENLTLNLQDRQACREAVRGCGRVYNLAADMGGMGFIEGNKSLCMLNTLINTHLLMAASESGVSRLFFSSSACVYPAGRQQESVGPGLREEEAYPADPEDGYGWEKLFSERMCRHFQEDFGIETRIARFHNIFGPHGTFEGGREKVPAAICRKVIAAKLEGSGEIEIWGDGQQSRSFLSVDDCIDGARLIMDGPVDYPLNLGSDEPVTINALVDLVEQIAGTRLKRRYRMDCPKGVRGRCSDNTLIEKLLAWKPSVSLRTGLEKTYAWIHDRMVGRKRGGLPHTPANAA